MWLHSQVYHFKILSLFLFLEPKPRDLNFAEIHARGGRGLQRPTFRDLIPPWGHSPFGPGRGTAPFRGVRSPEHTGLCRGGGRRAQRAGADVAEGTRGAGVAAWAEPGVGTRRRGEAGRRRGRAGRGNRAVSARRSGGRAVPRAGAARGVWAKRGHIRARAGAWRPKGAVSGGGAWRGGGALGRGGGPGARRHSTLSVAACVGSGEHPGGAGGAARREGAFSLYKEARRSAGFYLSNQSCSIPITLCFRLGCFFGGAE